MRDKITLLRVFVASPEDVPEEREKLRKVIDELNHGIVKGKDLMLQFVGWETDAWPDFGQDAQDVVNRQIGPYDIFVGIMWKRIGTPTRRADSGTVEEFERAYSLWLEYRRPKIMLYFSKTPFFPSADELEQVAKVLAFRERVRDKGALYWVYNGPDDFERLVRQHLIQEILRWEDDTKMAEALREVLPYVVELSGEGVCGDLWAKLEEIVHWMIPNSNLGLYVCDHANHPHIASLKGSGSELSSRLKPTWSVRETPFIPEVSVDAEACLIVEARSPQGTLEGFLILERTPTGDSVMRCFDEIDRLVLITLACAVGIALSRQRIQRYTQLGSNDSEKGR